MMNTELVVQVNIRENTRGHAHHVRKNCANDLYARHVYSIQKNKFTKQFKDIERKFQLYMPHTFDN